MHVRERRRRPQTDIALRQEDRGRQHVRAVPVGHPLDKDLAAIGGREQAVLQDLSRRSRGHHPAAARAAYVAKITRD